MARIMMGICALLVLIPVPARAQTVDVGASVSHVCRGSEGSACGGETLALPSWFASVWMAGRLEIQGRFGQGHLRDRRVEVSRDYRFPSAAPDRVTVFYEDSGLRYADVNLVYHFRRGKRVRPLVGFGTGFVQLPRHLRCAPSGCEPLLPLLAGPSEAPRNSDTVITTGFSVRAASRVTIRAGLSLHNFPGEGLSSQEWFAAVAWRLRRD